MMEDSMMTKRIRTVAAALIAVAGAFAGTSAQAPGFQRTVLQQGDLSVPGHQAVMARAEFAPGANVGRHTHPGEEISYVLEGTVTLEVQGQPPKVLKAGDVFLIPAGKVHDAKNTGTTPAKVLATYVVEKGKPLTTPAQ
jgi:quercetin dioxygenase-like cupin family protein